MKTKVASKTIKAMRQRSDRGATATEYGLLVGFIAMALVLGVTAFGGAVNTMYDGLAAVIASF